eukprot:4888380-Ditylum_brightwellii.AAC.1
MSSIAACVAASTSVAWGSCMLGRKKLIVSPILSALDIGQNTLKHLQCSIAGPMYQPLTPCGSHELRWPGLSWMIILLPGGANGVLL